MNKIKAVYDVVKTMKDKTSREGILQVKVEQDGQQVWNFSNEFQHNDDGKTKCKLKSEWNVDGNEGRHESTTEFTRNGHEGFGCHRGFRHFRHHERFGHEHGKQRGFKSRAEGFLFLLRMLNELKVEEQGEKLLFSLDLGEEVKQIRDRMQGKFEQNMMFQGPPHHHHHPLKGKLMKEIMLMDKPQILINMVANKDKEVEKAVITIQGKYEKDGVHELKASAEINFTN
ncbi:hypothetical protein HPT25_10870 [Bacillus sp. BRMEA1]|uniref:hypothetical protein n=1 Tax=Neobacillus endophyticus TaxID=2738405 RepID=UPI001563298F|nr:hypothetical protein [Neobacillus endophyticus]NRD77884.1 hypothetical protein [Neobacillus endophyticus]